MTSSPPATTETGRRIYPPARVHWAYPEGSPGSLSGACYTTGGLVEVTAQHVILIQSQWPAAGYTTGIVELTAEQFIGGWDYETGEPITLED